MIWNYYNLKFKTQIESELVLFDIIEGEKIPRYNNLDIIGLIYFEEFPDTPREGWYVNIAIQGDLPLNLKPYLITSPVHPKRIWAITNEGALL